MRVESSALIFHLLELNSGISFMPIAQVLKIHRIFSGHEAKIHMAHIKDEIPKASIGLAYHRSFTFTLCGQLPAGACEGVLP